MNFDFQYDRFDPARLSDALEAARFTEERRGVHAVWSFGSPRAGAWIETVPEATVRKQVFVKSEREKWVHGDRCLQQNAKFLSS